jgi:AcrR family transcriptional regulator
MEARTGKSELTLAAIVDTALDMVAESGMESLSIGEVAVRLNMSKSGVFSRVGSREALQLAVLAEFDRRFLQDVFAPAMRAPRGLPRLNALMHNWIERARRVDMKTGCLYVAGAFEYDDVQSPMRDELLGHTLKWRQQMRRAVQMAVDERHLRSDTDPDQLVFEIYSLMVGLMHDARFLRDNKALQRVQSAYERLISTYRSFDYKDKQ